MFFPPPNGATRKTIIIRPALDEDASFGHRSRASFEHQHGIMGACASIKQPQATANSSPAAGLESAGGPSQAAAAMKGSALGTKRRRKTHLSDAPTHADSSSDLQDGDGEDDRAEQATDDVSASAAHEPAQEAACQLPLEAANSGSAQATADADDGPSAQAPFAPNASPLVGGSLALQEQPAPQPGAAPTTSGPLECKPAEEEGAAVRPPDLAMESSGSGGADEGSLLPSTAETDSDARPAHVPVPEPVASSADQARPSAADAPVASQPGAQEAAEADAKPTAQAEAAEEADDDAEAEEGEAGDKAEAETKAAPEVEAGAGGEAEAEPSVPAETKATIEAAAVAAATASESAMDERAAGSSAAKGAQAEGAPLPPPVPPPRQTVPATTPASTAAGAAQPVEPAAETPSATSFALFGIRFELPWAASAKQPRPPA